MLNIAIGAVTLQTSLMGCVSMDGESILKQCLCPDVLASAYTFAAPCCRGHCCLQLQSLLNFSGSKISVISLAIFQFQFTQFLSKIFYHLMP